MSYKFTLNRVYISSLAIILGISYSLQPALALKMMYESSIKDLTPKIELLGNDAGGQFGAATIIGDLNGDNRDDLIVSSPYASEEEKQWNGQIDLILSEESNNKEIISIVGDEPGDQLGTSLAVGDFNGDGIDDLAIGAHNASFNERRSGKVYIINGDLDLSSQMGRQAPSQNYRQVGILASKQVNGERTGDSFGMSIASFDINKDDIQDLIIGAPHASTPNIDKVGAVYIYHGSTSGLANSPNDSVYGYVEDERFGSKVGAGYITSIENADLVVGAYKASKGEKTQAGKVYLYKNIPNKNLQDSDLTFSGGEENDWFGFNFAIGDLDQDQFEDLAISSFPYINPKYSGKVSIFYGGNDLNHQQPDFIIKKTVGESRLGLSLLIKDINQDDKADILIGAPGINIGKSTEAGHLYGFYGKTDGFLSSYIIEDRDMDLVISGENSDDWFGSSIELLDFNGDGEKDLFVSGRYADNQTIQNSGKGYVIPGNNGSFVSTKLISEPGSRGVSRGELLKVVFDSFDIKDKKAEYIQSCYQYSEFCLFNFLAMSSFEGIQLKPEVVLYPDVQPNNPYYEEINLATMLGFVNGYTYLKDSPFYPDVKITRIQALKVILSATELVEPKYRAELQIIENTPFRDVSSKNETTWWYARYLNFAIKEDIIDSANLFRPDEDITPEELNDMISRTLLHLNSRDEKAES